MFVENLGAPWSSGAWGPGPNGPVVNTPLIETMQEKVDAIELQQDELEQYSRRNSVRLSGLTEGANEGGAGHIKQCDVHHAPYRHL